jgi:nucleotide-binding universal stress UspA family protein
VLDEMRDHLRSFAETVAPGLGPRARVEARRDDDLVKSVANAAAEMGASILILGSITAERPRWRRSLAERIARAVSCPVLVVPY